MSRFEIKIVAALLVIAIIPLATSVVLVGQVIRVSNSFAEGQIQYLAEPLERSAEAYRGLFSARKRVFLLEARLMAADPELTRLLSVEAMSTDTLDALSRRLRILGEEHRGVGQIELRGPMGKVLVSVDRSSGFSADAYRDLRLIRAVQGVLGYKLYLTFFTPRAPFEDFRSLGQAQGSADHLTALRDELSTYYRVAFFIIFGAVLVVATALGIFISRRTTRRVAVLAAATNKVAEGDLDTRVEIRAHDELGDLATAFNQMVRQVKESRERIAYLEKIGAWQEIARRLAHEIKNPLTPIQLAVQQVHSKYSGDDPKFQALLEDARDIVFEEIAGLRRLVQDFSAFAKLPSVQPEPVDINALVDDFFKSHQDLKERSRLTWNPVAPPQMVLVDRMLIKHVLYNLVHNALEAGEEAGLTDPVKVTLTAAVDRRRQRATLTVSDDGPGMTAEVAERVFEPYFTTKEKGTGLGLAIVKKIILEHRGTITVRSTIGSGTAFVVTLPLAAAEEHRATGPLQRATARFQRRVGGGSRPR